MYTHPLLTMRQQQQRQRGQYSGSVHDIIAYQERYTSKQVVGTYQQSIKFADLQQFFLFTRVHSSSTAVYDVWVKQEKRRVCRYADLA